MALVIADRVKESSTTTGTGNFALGGAVHRIPSSGNFGNMADRGSFVGRSRFPSSVSFGSGASDVVLFHGVVVGDHSVGTH